MTDRKDDEETYSLIFTSLRHPVRRKILRMLESQELTFSEILEILAIESGHLSYHLENLGDLITRTSDGKYELSSFGFAAMRLMKGVEEYNPPSKSKPSSHTVNFIKIFSMVLVAMVLVLSFYSLTFVIASSGEVIGWPSTSSIFNGFNSSSGFEPIQLALSPNQTFGYAINFTYSRFEPARASSKWVVIGTHFANSISEWDEYGVRLDFVFSQNETHHMLNMTVRDASAKLIFWTLWGGEPGPQSGGTGPIITRPGNYTLGLQNVGNGSVSAALGVRILKQSYERPLFYYGIAGIITAALYPLAVLAIWRWRKPDPQTETPDHKTL